MKQIRLQLILGLTLGMLLLSLLVIPVLATYSSTISVTESSSNSYTSLPIITSADVDYMADNDYITSTGLDTRVSTLADGALPHMLADDKILFVSDIAADSTSNFSFTTGNSAITAFDIVLGKGGYITTADAAALELGSDFELVLDGYFDTTAGNGNILYKNGAIQLAVDGVSDGELDIAATGAITGYSVTGIDSGDYEFKLTGGDNTDDQPLVSGVFTPLGGTYYTNLQGTSYYGSATNARIPISADGVIKNLYVETETAPIGGDNLIFTLMKNGVATSLTCTVSGIDSETTANDTSHTVSVSAGDDVYMRVFANDDMDETRFSVVFSANTDSESVLMFTTGANQLDTSANSYLPVIGTSEKSTYEYVVQSLIASANITISDLRVALDNAPGSGKSFTFTVRKNGAGAGIATTISDTDTTGTDLVNTASYTAGDRICIYQTGSGASSTSRARISLKVESTAQDGRSLLSSVIDGDPLTAQYGAVSGTSSTALTATTASQLVSIGDANLVTNIDDMYVYLTAAPGAGKSYTITLYKNGSPTTMTTTISDANTTGNDTAHPISISSGDDLYFVVSPTGTPADSWVSIGFIVDDARYGDGIDFYIDDVLVGGENMSAGVADNANNWVIGGNAISYLNYYTHDVSSSELIEYRPDSIISGTTMPNEDSPGTYDGTITWGSNPGGVAVAAGSLISSGEPTGATGSFDTDSDDIVGEAGQNNWTRDAGALASNPFYPLINTFADLTEIPVNIMWICVASFITLAVMLVSFKSMPHLTITAFIGFIMILGFWYAGIYPFWCIFIYVVGAFALIIYERQPSV